MCIAVKLDNSREYMKCVTISECQFVDVWDDNLEFCL